MLNYATCKVESACDSLAKEVAACNNDVGKRHENERMEVVKRVYMAKELCFEFGQEVENKL
jgi:hypothetical protein